MQELYLNVHRKAGYKSLSPLHLGLDFLMRRHHLVSTELSVLRLHFVRSFALFSVRDDRDRSHKNAVLDFD